MEEAYGIQFRSKGVDGAEKKETGG